MRDAIGEPRLSTPTPIVRRLADPPELAGTLPALLRSLESSLASARYGEAEIAEAARRGRHLAAQDALPRELEADYARERLPVLVALFLLGRRVERADAERGLAGVDVDVLLDAGLLELDAGAVRCPYRLMPHDGLLLFGDGDERTGQPDTVLARTRAAEFLSWLTPRRAHRSVLDLGCGSGMHALIHARECPRVVGVDINPRALAFARLNAALNGLPGPQWRLGSWLDPVAEERFELIVSNPPCVISPDEEFVHRDSGRPAGALLGRLCNTIPSHLEEGGMAVILCEWLHSGAADWDSMPRRWVERTGCDALVVCLRSIDPLTHALDWNAPAARALGPDALRATLARWCSYCEELGAGAVSFGAVAMRRRGAGAPWVHSLRASEPPGPGASRQLSRAFAGLDLLRTETDLLGHTFVSPTGLSVTQSFVKDEHAYRTRAATLSVPGELGVRSSVDPQALDVLFGLDGVRTLREVVERVAARRGFDRARMEDLAPVAVAELLASGLLDPA